MKKRNYKILFAAIALSVSTTLTVSPLLTTANAATTEETTSASSKFDVKLKSQYAGSQLNNEYTLTNSGSSIDLAKVKIRYYFKADENTESQVFTCFYAGLEVKNHSYKNITPKVHGTFAKLDEPEEKADSYLEISFDKDAGNFNANGILNLNTGMNNNNWQPFNSTDDYSYNDASKVEVLVDGETVSGTTPVKQEKPEPIAEGSLLSKNYLNYDEDNLADVKISIAEDCKGISFIKDITDLDQVNLNDKTEYTVKGNTLTLKKEYLKTLLSKNAFLKVYFNNKKSQTIFVNNSKVAEKSDPERSGISKDEPEISFSKTPNNDTLGKRYQPYVFTITNTSNVNLDLSKIMIYDFYDSHNTSYIDFPITYASVIGSNKDLSADMETYGRPDGDDFGLRTHFMETYFKRNSKAGVLKPNETLVISEYFNYLDNPTDIKKSQDPVVTYDGESIYGNFPEELQQNSEIITKDIEFAKETADTTVNLKLKSNVLNSIEAYSKSSLIKTLEKGTDYELTKRDEVILKKSFLDSLENRITTLNFKFSNGKTDTINITKDSIEDKLQEGSLSINDKAASAFCNGSLNGNNQWTNLDVPISLSNIKDEKVTDGKFTLNYDPHYFSDAKLAVCNPKIASANVNTELGTITITLNDKVSSNDTLFNLTLVPNKSSYPVAAPYGEAQKLSLAEDSYYVTEDGTKYSFQSKFNDFDLRSDGGYAEENMAEVEAKQGEVVSIPVTAKDAKFYNINCFNIGFNYDTNVFESAQITPGNLLENPGKLFTTSRNLSKGEVSCVYNKDGDKTYDIDEDGVLFNIVLRVKNDAPVGKTSLTEMKGNSLTGASNSKKVYFDLALNLKTNPLTINENKVLKDITHTAAPTEKPSEDAIKDLLSKSKGDETRSGISQDEPEISFAMTPDTDDTSVKGGQAYTYAITNTSKVDMDISKFRLFDFYNVLNDASVGVSKTYATILGTNEDLTSDMSIYQRPDGDDFFFNTHVNCTSFSNKTTAVLKPGQTLLIGQYYTYSNKYLSFIKLQSPVVTYDDESVYGDLPKDIERNSELENKDIKFSKENMPKDTTVKLKLNSNSLTYIKAYAKGSLVKTLEKGTDYELTKRDEVVLNKSFLDSLKNEYTTLDFGFSGGFDESISITNTALHENIEAGYLTIANEDALLFGKLNVINGACKWEDDLRVPITLEALKDSKITEGKITLKYDPHFFSNAKVELLSTKIASVDINKEIGTVNITLKSKSFTENMNTALFTLVLTPDEKSSYIPYPPYNKMQTLSLSEDSYYVTEDGTKYSIQGKFIDFKLLSSFDIPTESSEKAEVKQGETVTIPVTIKDAKYYNIRNFDLGFSYNTTIFESANITPGDIIKNANDFTSSNNTEEGTVSCIYNKNKDDENIINEDGVLFNIVLKAKKDAPLGETTLKGIKYNKLYVYTHSKDDSANFPNFILSPITVVEK